MEQPARNILRSAAISLSLCLWCLPAHAQLRVVSWNTAGGPRAGLGDILEAIGNESVNGIAKPIDVLSLQEQTSSATTTQGIVDLLNGIYGAGTYDRATLDGDTSGAGRPGLIYNTTTIALESQIAFGTVDTSAQARQTLRYQLQPLGYDDSAEFYVYSNHYKASTGSSNRARRLIEAEAVRADADALGQGANIIYSGDFNVRSSSESSYQELLSAGNGQAFDPIDTPGSWHDSATFKLVHTQAPSTSPPSGLVGAGIDDRFDFQLVSGELLDSVSFEYIPDSYRVFGNNGTHNLNESISTGTGTSALILSTLEAVSDHLPVVADYHVIPTSPTADFNRDGDIDGEDFLTWQRGLGDGILLSQGDANGSLTVDFSDLVIWESQFGTSVSTLVAVPEPSAVLIALMGLVTLLKPFSRRTPSADRPDRL